MGMITAQRITAALLGGSMNAAQLTAQLTTPSGLAGWKFACATPSLVELLAADATAKTAWQGSTQAMDTMVMLSPAGATAMASSSTIMAAAFNAAARADIWFASPHGRAAIWGSDVALTALMASATGKVRAAACSRHAMVSFASTTAFSPFPKPLNGRCILLNWHGDASPNYEFSGRRDNSTVGVVKASMPIVKSENVMALQSAQGRINSGASSINSIFHGVEV